MKLEIGHHYDIIYLQNVSQETPVFVFVGVPDKIEPVIFLPDWICWWLKGFYPNFHYIYSIWYTINKEKTLHNLKRHLQAYLTIFTCSNRFSEE